MFSIPRLKLYRQFLILAVLLCALSISLYSTQETSANFCSPPMYDMCCCSTCTQWTWDCETENGCGNYPPGPERQACFTMCHDMYYECRVDCMYC